MAKIINDKYYTPIEIANYCWGIVDKIIGLKNVSQIIEPSCGNGAFYYYDKRQPDIGYDIEPECGFPNVIKADFLSVQVDYLKGRLIIGNPPFGEKSYLAQLFYKHSVLMGDYVAFILPIKQLNNNHFLYEFDLIYSEDLGVKEYSGIKLHCCFNVYKRPINGKLNKKPKKLKSDYIKIYRQDKKDYDSLDFDFRMCHWGNGSAGRILNADEPKYAGEYKIKILDHPLRDDIINFFCTFNWKSRIGNKNIAMNTIKQYEILEILYEYFPSIFND